jgi:ferritin-like metal-binding protein YciE
VSKYFPKIIKNSCNYELIEALYIHQNESQKQVIRIEESFELLKEQSLLAQNAAIDTLLSELDNAIEITKFGMIRDAGIILSLHKIEHYEIASYSILTLFAENLKEKVAQMRLAKITNTIQFHPPEAR